jgi:CHASE2 domain-containing sensor protein/tRNA A-37 threonylcarbamoyl transferase component Bud32
VSGRTQWFVALALLAVGLTAGAAGELSRNLHLLTWVEQPSVDARFAIRGKTTISKDVAVVALDTESYRQLPLPPLPRALDAQLVERLDKAGAAVVAFDFALERPSSSIRGDMQVIDALEHARHAVVSVTIVSANGQTEPLAGRVPFSEIGVRPGVTLLRLDSDGAVRRFPSGLGGMPSFSLAAAQGYSHSLEGSVPSGALIDYPGPPGSLPTISFLEVLRGDFNAHLVAGKIVVVGPTAPVLQDLHRTPVGAAMSGPEIQADAITTALEGYPLRYATGSLTKLLLLVLGLLVSLLTLGASSLWQLRPSARKDMLSASAPDALFALFAGTAVAIAWSLASQVAFDHGTVLDYVDGMLTIAFAATGVWVLAEIATRKERRGVRKLFAASTPEVVDRVLRNPGYRSATITAESVIAGYRIEQQIGKGGMGVVYRAVQSRLQRTVALKLIRAEYAESEIYRTRFERESQLAAAVSHPNVIPVLDAGDDDGLLYLSMQLIRGISLGRVLRGNDTLAPAMVAEIIMQVGSALDAVHERSLVHRDVKPANILLRAGNASHALLTDFGLAKSFAGIDGSTPSEGWAGSLDYVAPEQLEGHSVDHRADVYALTAVLYHCLTGRVPFPQAEKVAKIAAHLHAPRPSARDLRPDLPGAIDELIARGMAIAVEGRPPSAAALGAEAAAILTGSTVRPAASWPLEIAPEPDPADSEGGSADATRPPQP